jgi:dTDP-D-glucose 4,6-dehydratase
MFDVVTGGAGFIGSHLVDTLVAQGNEVLVIDSLCAGRRECIARHIDTGVARLVQADLLDDGWQEHIEGADRVFHLAADPDVRQSAIPSISSGGQRWERSAMEKPVASSRVSLNWPVSDANRMAVVP